MNMPKLIAPVTMLLFTSICFLSCEKKQNLKNTITNYNATMVNSNNVPSSNVATGNVQATLDRNTHILSYKVFWFNLSSNPVAMHIHGLAGDGLVALPPPLGPFASGIVQTITGYPVAKSGSFSGSLYVDDVAIKEADLVNGQYYLDIHTVNYSSALYPAGEIRGQIVLRY